MSYISPFHLLPEHEVANFKLTDLNLWKEQLLTRLEQKQVATISINEREYTQKDILETFDLLEDSPEHHWRLFQNKPLLGFIEQGNIDFFKEEKNWTNFWDTPYRDWLAKWFVPQYDNALHHIAQNAPTSAEAIQILKASTFQLPQQWNDEATKQTRQFFNDFLENANTEFDAPDAIIQDKKLSLKRDIRPYIDYNHVEILNVLPPHFENIKQDYGTFAHEVVDKLTRRAQKLKYIEAGTLKTLREAAKIDVAIHDNKYSKNILAQIGEPERLHRSASPKRQKEKSYFAYFLLIPLAIIFIGVSYIGINVYKNLEKLSDENVSKISYIKDVRKLDIFGEWITEAEAEGFLLEKKLAFTNEASGILNIVISDSVNNNNCELNSDFTWTLIRDEISIYYDDIQLKKDFNKNTKESIVNSKDYLMEQTSDALKVDTVRMDYVSSPIFILTKGNTTYVRTGKTGLDDLDSTDLTKMKFRQQTALIISRFRPSDFTGSFNIQREKDGDWYGIYADEKVKIATGEMRGDIYHIVTDQWATKKSGYTYAGILEDVYFIDQNSRPRFGHLKIYFNLVDGLDVKFQATTERPKVQTKQEEKNKTIKPPPPRPSAINANPDRKESEKPQKLPNMLDIPAGTFTMGCTSGDTDCSKDEKPAHQVSLEAFQMSRYEITNAQYCVFLNEKGKHRGAHLWIDIGHIDARIKLEDGKYVPTFPSLSHHPVVKVTWNGANTYCRWLSKKMGEKYTLPTEAQWEYAARGGQAHLYAGNDDINRVAAYATNTRQTCEVNSKRLPNGYGLYDMSGNVWEWCADWYKENHYASKKSPEKGPSVGSKRVLRGGSWTENATSCRVSHRNWYYPVYSSHNVGFRCVIN